MTTEPMPCRRLVELVTDYLEGALDEDTTRAFERHLATCDGCAAYVDQMRATLDLLGHIPPETLEPVVRDRLLATFRGWLAGRREP